MHWFSTVDKFSPVISYWLCKHGMLYIYCVYYYSLHEWLCNEHMKNKYPMTKSWEWPYVPFNKNGDCETMKVLLNCIVCYEQSDFPKKVITVFIMSLYIHDIRLLTCDLYGMSWSWSYGSWIFNFLCNQCMPITTNLVSLNPVHGEVYLIQHYVLKFVSDLRHVSGFLRKLRFPPRYNWNIVESGIKHHKPNHMWSVMGFPRSPMHWCISEGEQVRDLITYDMWHRV